MIMKTERFFHSVILLMFLGISCQNDFDLKNPNVDQFVSLLKDGSYADKVGHELPNFSIKHIERLLYYSKDTAVLKMFPANPVSSLHTYPKVLSECILWTIDGIRLERKYPSLEPSLRDTLAYTPTMEYPRLTGKELLKISDIYMNWYDDYKKKPSDSLKKKNLLESTSYKWF
jgi:hypothetical protein